MSGSSFYGFIRDEYTTLPEAKDRPLFIFLDILWTYEKNRGRAQARDGKVRGGRADSRYRTQRFLRIRHPPRSNT
ncbi:hypothetical protein [Cohnella rhizosphaerae]|uniref:hypothetical protein n=1 Tax=Cohnella rhizosphaerae TaxID=1457232 RepID=UPI0030B89B5E